MKVECLIVDDEPLARKLIASYAARMDVLNVAGSCGSALEAMDVLHRRRVDLMFLDIQMPEFTGLQMIRSLAQPPSIVLITAHRDFAVEAFDLKVLDYLVKPVSFERFSKAVNRYFDQTSFQSRESHAKEEIEFILIPSGRKVHKVPLREIVFVESLDDHVNVHLDNGILSSRNTISAFAHELPPSAFVRIHRSFIVSRSKIRTISSEGVEVLGRLLPFGRMFRQEALKRL